ncbi:MAG: hypothetical protein DIU71_03680 [Proteobacteria bacterium]|nr:MAG: hypothetical protein DIU71_03680 [Pseudomonadota bacterium]
MTISMALHKVGTASPDAPAGAARRVCRVRSWAVCVTLALGALAAPATTQAFETGFYVGGYYAQASKDIDQAGFDDFNAVLYDFFGFTPGPVATEFDDEDHGYGFLVGYRLLRNLGFEASYTDYGKVNYDSSTPGAFDDGADTLDINLKTRTRGISVSALGFLPLSYSIEAYGRAGLLFGSHELTVFASALERGAFATRTSGSSVDWLVGAGLALRFLEIYALRAEYTRVMGVGSDETGTGDIDMLAVGLTVRF